MAATDGPHRPRLCEAATGTGADGTDADGTGADPCGNGIVEAGESCDDHGESATCDADCTEVVCGDAIINTTASEECDGTDLAGASCSTVGFGGGTLSCGPGCAYDTSDCGYLPDAAVLELSFSQIKQFDFNWTAAAGADFYQLWEWETAAPGELREQIGGDIFGESISIEMPLHLRAEASYVLGACNGAGCTESEPVSVTGSLAEAVGYFKASNTGSDDVFGASIALSGDGDTLVVGAHRERSTATGTDGDQTDDSAIQAGAAYVFVRDRAGGWSQQAYIKASNTDPYDWFSWSVGLSNDGNTLAVGAPNEDSNATGIDGDQSDNTASGSGAVYVFVRDGTNDWTQQAYIKASNTSGADGFGWQLALSGDGNTLSVGASGESSNANGIDGNQLDDSEMGAGAVYVFVRDIDQWTQQAYVKSSNTGAGDGFGSSLALGDNGDTLSVGAPGESSNAMGIDGDQDDNSVFHAGAVYVFVRNRMDQWSQQAYIKASNTGFDDGFGYTIALSGDGNTLAAASVDDSDATGINGYQFDESLENAGAAYVFMRDKMSQWSQQTYIKPSNTDEDDWFGEGLALNGDGTILAVGAYSEEGDAIGINGNRANESMHDAGAVYVYARNEMDPWSQWAYVKASNTGPLDDFGWSVALSDDGNTLAIAAPTEDSDSVGVGGDQANDILPQSGAVYLF